MSQYYADQMRYTENFRLHPDDIRAVQAYYGKPWRKWKNEVVKNDSEGDYVDEGKEGECDDRYVFIFIFS